LSQELTEVVKKQGIDGSLDNRFTRENLLGGAMLHEALIRWAASLGLKPRTLIAEGEVKWIVCFVKFLTDAEKERHFMGIIAWWG